LIKNLVFFLLLIISFSIYGKAVDIKEVTDKEILDQLNNDTTMIPMQKGALFVPYIVDPLLEPHYTMIFLQMRSRGGEYLFLKVNIPFI